MKTTFVRAIVLSLAFVGLVAPSMTSAKTASPAKTASSSFSGYPSPMCMPGSGNYCGLQ